MFIVGVDIAKNSHEATIIDQQGTVIGKSLRFANSNAGYNKLMSLIRTLDEPVVFGMEATGHYWLSTYCFLQDQGYQIHVINPIQSDAVRNLYIRKSKTDRKDAFILADLLRMNQTQETFLASETVLKLQTLSRTRFGFVDQVALMLPDKKDAWLSRFALILIGIRALVP